MSGRWAGAGERAGGPRGGRGGVTGLRFGGSLTARPRRPPAGRGPCSTAPPACQRWPVGKVVFPCRLLCSPEVSRLLHRSLRPKIIFRGWFTLGTVRHCCDSGAVGDQAAAGCERVFAVLGRALRRLSNNEGRLQDIVPGLSVHPP